MPSQTQQPRKHVYLKHEHCELAHCMFCDGGLLYCTVCRQGEAELTDECSGGDYDLIGDADVSSAAA